MATVLITQCLQRDFVDPIGPHDPFDEPVKVDRPGVNVVVHGSTSATSESPLDRLEQLGLLARRPDEDARLTHGRFMVTDRGSMLNKQPQGGGRFQS